MDVSGCLAAGLEGGWLVDWDRSDEWDRPGLEGGRESKGDREMQ